MNYKLFWLSILLISPLLGMESPAQDPEVEKVIKEINEADRAKNEQRALLLYHQPFPQKVELADYYILQNLCKPKHALLLERLIKKKIVNPNTYLVLASGSGKCGLLGEAIYFLNPSKCKKTPFKKDLYATIKILLAAKANPNQELWSLSEVREPHSSSNTPLVRAVWMEDYNLVLLLLQNGADANVRNQVGISPLFMAIRRYGDNGVEDNLKRYQIVQALLEHGAFTDLPSSDGFGKFARIVTPVHSATKDLVKGSKDILDLFKQYPNNTVARSSKK
ncbi:hypothetical protein BH09DEP1_BH09DEP1_3000 [soil metagenome]